MLAPHSGSSLIGVGASAQRKTFSLFLSPPSFPVPEAQNVLAVPEFACANSAHRSVSGKFYLDLTSKIPDSYPAVEGFFDDDDDVVITLPEDTWQTLADHFYTPPPPLSILGINFTERQLIYFASSFSEDVTFKVGKSFPYTFVKVNGSGTHVSSGTSTLRTLSTQYTSLKEHFVYFERAE